MAALKPLKPLKPLRPLRGLPEPDPQRVNAQRIAPRTDWTVIH